ILMIILCLITIVISSISFRLILHSFERSTITIAADIADILLVIMCLCQIFTSLIVLYANYSYQLNLFIPWIFSTLFLIVFELFHVTYGNIVIYNQLKLNYFLNRLVLFDISFYILKTIIYFLTLVVIISRYKQLVYTLNDDETEIML
ncbi:unnamed protein product, partial [Didymodactylos carnosus]